ncbi:MAG: hypothetical protein ABI702_04670 [Burkholderiales bacterium]
MKLILTQIAQLLIALLATYGVLLAISLQLVPRADVGDRLDAARASSSLYLTETKYVFMARSPLKTAADKAILLGASNMLAGFKQAQVQVRVPGMAVHNLSVGGSNITQMSQIVDLVREVQTPEARRHNTYVIGLWYGLFTDDKARWYTPDRYPGDTDIDIERYRYGFYRRTEAGAVPLLPPLYLDTGVLLIHPYLVLDRTARDLTRTLRNRMAAKPAPITDEQRDAVVLSDAQKAKYLAFWRDYTAGADTVGDAPFHVLERMIEGILAEGGRVVLVDMPIPRWHAKGSPLAADYRHRIDVLLADLSARPGVSVLAMGDMATDNDFSDEVHPKPRVTERWAERLAAALNETASTGPAQSASAR